MQATEPELAVYRVLIKLGVPFQFTDGLSDFYVPDRSLILSVSDITSQASDRLRRMAREGQGVRTIYIDAEDALKNATFYVTEALEGRSHSKLR